MTITTRRAEALRRRIDHPALVEVGRAAVQLVVDRETGLGVADLVIIQHAARVRYRVRHMAMGVREASVVERRDPIAASALLSVDSDRRRRLEDAVADAWPQIIAAAGELAEADHRGEVLATDQSSRLSIEQLCDRWSVSPDVVRGAIHRGALPASRIGRAYRIKLADAIAYEEARR